MLYKKIIYLLDIIWRLSVTTNWKTVVRAENGRDILRNYARVVSSAWVSYVRRASNKGLKKGIDFFQVVTKVYDIYSDGAEDR